MDKEEKIAIEDVKKKLEEINIFVQKPDEYKKTLIKEGETLKDNGSKLDAKVKTLDGEVKNQGAIKGKLKECQEELNTSNSHVSELSNENKKTHDKMASLKKQNSLLKDSNKELLAKINKLTAQLMVTTGYYNNLKGHHEKDEQVHAEEVASLKQKATKLQDVIDLSKAQSEKMEIEINYNKDELDALKDKCSKEAKAKSALESEKKAAQQLIDSLKNELSSCKIDKGKLLSQVKLLEDKSRSDAINAEDERALLNRKIVVLSQLSNDLNTKQTDLTKKNEEHVETQKATKRDSAKELNDLRASNKLEQENAQKTLVANTKQIRFLENQLKEYKEKQEHFDSTVEVTNAFNEFNKRLDELVAKRMEFTLTIRILDEKVCNQNEEVKNMNDQLANNAQKISKLTTQVKDTEKALEKTTAEKDGLKRILMKQELKTRYLLIVSILPNQLLLSKLILSRIEMRLSLILEIS